MAKRRSLQDAAKKGGEQPDEVLSGPVVQDDVAAVDVGQDDSAPTGTELETAPGWLTAAFDETEMDLPLSQVYQRVEQAAVGLLERGFEAGRWLLLAKARTPHGLWKSYIEESCPFSPRLASQMMLMSRRVLESPDGRTVRAFLEQVSGGAPSKARLLLGMSDDEIGQAMDEGEILGRPLEEVGEMSYKQLQEELRKSKRNADRISKQRDDAEGKVQDLEEENQRLRGLASDDTVPQTALEKAHIETMQQLGRFQAVVEDAPDEERKRDGRRYYNTLQQMLNSVMAELVPLEAELEPWGEGEEAPA